MSGQIRNEHPTVPRQVSADVLPGAAAITQAMQKDERGIGIRVANFNPVQIDATDIGVAMLCRLISGDWLKNSFHNCHL